MLVTEITGFWLCAKRMETARFNLPAVAERNPAAALPLNIDRPQGHPRISAACAGGMLGACPQIK